MEWGALTDPERFNDWYWEERNRFSDMARDADWHALFEELLTRQSGPGWVNLPRIGNHPNRSGFAPLHQAAWHGAPFAVASRLIAHGAWRTQRARDGRRAVDIARERGHTHLLQLLEPVVVRQLPSLPEILEHHFHSLLQARIGPCFEETEHLLPPLAPLTEGPAVEITFTAWGADGRRHLPPGGGPSVRTHPPADGCRRRRALPGHPRRLDQSPIPASVAARSACPAAPDVLTDERPAPRRPCPCPACRRGGTAADTCGPGRPEPAAGPRHCCPPGQSVTGRFSESLGSLMIFPVGGRTR